MRFKYKNTQSLTARVALLAMFFFKTVILTAQPIQFIDSQTQKPISFATVSFGNGLGSYANADGIFNFNSKRLSAIDTLFVSAMGYNQIIIETKNLKASYLLTPTADELDEVLVVAQRRGRFRRRQLRPVTHQEYHNSWLQTLESEIAVKFEPFQEKPTQITAILLPVNIREEVAGKTFPARPFSTMMRIKFYENNQGLPGNEIAYDNIVFIITEKHQNNVFEVDISQQSVFIPKDGIFIAVQVLGPTDRQGNLAETRIYNEFETERFLKGKTRPGKNT